MIRAVMEGDGQTLFAVIGLVLFVAAFGGVALWVFTRRQKQVNKWSQIPLQDDPVEPRGQDETDANADEPAADERGDAETQR